MDSKLMKTFVTVANHSSFTDAAKELYIAQSAVSKQISQLEKEVGTQLFLRDTRMVRLTAAGEGFYKDAVDILARMDAAEKRLQGGEAEAGRLTAGAFSVLATEVVELMRQFRQRHPTIETTLDWYEFSTLARRVEDGTLDVAFTIAFELMGKPHLRSQTVEKGRMSVLLGRRNPLAGAKELRLRELAGQSYFTMRPDVTANGYMNIMRYFTEKNFQPGHICQHTSHESMMLQLQLHDDAYGLMGEYQHRGHPELVFVPLAEEDQPAGGGFDLVAAWHGRNENPGLTQLLAELEPD